MIQALLICGPDRGSYVEVEEGVTEVELPAPLAIGPCPYCGECTSLTAHPPR